MAVNIFDKYGIKQVANVYFEALADEPASGVFKGDIVLFLDTLKVSTIETTAENVAAQGGWGNPRLVQWDYGKEINITLTDALMSLESLRFMMGGAIKEAKKGDDSNAIWVKHTAEVTVNSDGSIPFPKDRFGTTYYPEISDAHPMKVINLTTGTRTQVQDGKMANNDNTKYYLKIKNSRVAGLEVKDGTTEIQVAMTQGDTGYDSDATETQYKSVVTDNYVDATTGYFAQPGNVLRLFWEEKRTGEDKKGAVEITISPSTFPGTYRVVGDTFMRDTNGKDVPFQFIIEKAKVQSNVTLTLEAEGDPTTFEMTLNVLRDEYGDEMMKLVRYDSEGENTNDDGNDLGSLSTTTSNSNS